MSLDLMVFILEIVCPKDHTKKTKKKIYKDYTRNKQKTYR